MIPRQAHFVWLGGLENLPDQHSQWLSTFQAHNPHIPWIVWTEPDFTQDEQDKIQNLKDQEFSLAAISNVARLWLLKRHGGLYFDTDFEFLKPLDSLFNNSAVVALQDGGRACNAFMGAEPNHPWILGQLAAYWKLKYDPRDAATGVYVASDTSKAGVTIIQQHLIYPWMYDDPPEKRVPHPDSLVAHHWAGSWTKK